MIAENQTFWSLYLNFIKKELNQLRFQLDSHSPNFLSVSELEKKQVQERDMDKQENDRGKRAFQSLYVKF